MGGGAASSSSLMSENSVPVGLGIPELGMAPAREPQK